jgi:hypothetical protein
LACFPPFRIRISPASAEAASRRQGMRSAESMKEMFF